MTEQSGREIKRNDRAKGMGKHTGDGVAANLRCFRRYTDNNISHVGGESYGNCAHSMRTHVVAQPTTLRTIYSILPGRKVVLLRTTIILLLLTVPTRDRGPGGISSEDFPS